MIYLRRLAWTVLVSFALAGAGLGQTTQDASDNGVNVGGNNTGFINTGEIKVILQSEAALTGDAQERQALAWLSEVLPELVERGELSVSETGVRLLARDAIELLAKQPLTRNVIEQRQFTVTYQQTYNIAGTNHRITYIRNNCGANLGIIFRFNRNEYCWYGTGGTLDFTSGGRSFELVFDGYDESRNAMFTIYPSG
ncbi:MAG: hypothetical protein ABJO67_15460 [Pseudoruegeria sp.]